MQWWSTLLLEATKLCQIQAAVALLIMMVVLVVVAVRWVRRYHRQTLILLRGVAFQMIQNRPPTDDTTRLQENLNWWETEVLDILPRAGAKSHEIARFAVRSARERLPPGHDRREGHTPRCDHRSAGRRGLATRENVESSSQDRALLDGARSAGGAA